MIFLINSNDMKFSDNYLRYLLLNLKYIYKSIKLIIY